MDGLAKLLRLAVEAVARAFWPALFADAAERMRDTAEETRPDPSLTQRLRGRIAGTWGGAFGLLFLALTVAGAPGCGTRTVYVPDGRPVRLRAPAPADVWVMDADGRPRASTMTIPEGWYALPDPGE